MTLTMATSAGMIGVTQGGVIPSATTSSGTAAFTFDNTVVPPNKAAFAYTIESSSTADLDPIFQDNGSTCGGGGSDALGSCWLNGSTTAVRLVHRTSPTLPSGATSTLSFRMVMRQNPTPAIPQDSYQATTTITITAN